MYKGQINLQAKQTFLGAPGAQPGAGEEASDCAADERKNGLDHSLCEPWPINVEFEVHLFFPFCSAFWHDGDADSLSNLFETLEIIGDRVTGT